MGCLGVVLESKPVAKDVRICFDVNGRSQDAVSAVRSNAGTVQTQPRTIGGHGCRAEALDSEGNCVALPSKTGASSVQSSSSAKPNLPSQSLNLLKHSTSLRLSGKSLLDGVYRNRTWET